MPAIHPFLESKRDFSNWIKERIETYGFIEGQDFTSFHKFVKRGGSNLQSKTIEYALTLDMNKKLSMLEGNHKGKMARQYFIECEKRYKKQTQPKIDYSDPNYVLKLTCSQIIFSFP